MKSGKKIVQSSNFDRYDNHREDFVSCPHCKHEMETKEWDKIAHTLILSPRCIKSSCVASLSECPKCFKNSWVHEPIDSFEYTEFPEKWKEAVRKTGKEKKLNALRDWGRSLCWKCEKLESARVEFHAWRYCEMYGKGSSASGPAETKCEHFKNIENKT